MHDSFFSDSEDEGTTHLTKTIFSFHPLQSIKKWIGPKKDGPKKWRKKDNEKNTIKNERKKEHKCIKNVWKETIVKKKCNNDAPIY